MRHPGTLATCISKEGREAETEKEGMSIPTSLGQLAFGLHSQEVKWVTKDPHQSGREQRQESMWCWLSLFRSKPLARIQGPQEKGLVFIKYVVGVTAKWAPAQGLCQVQQGKQSKFTSWINMMGNGGKNPPTTNVRMFPSKSFLHPRQLQTRKNSSTLCW